MRSLMNNLIYKKRYRNASDVADPDTCARLRSWMVSPVAMGRWC